MLLVQKRTVFPKYQQHVDIPTRDKNTLDHVYSNIRGAYRAAPRPHFGHSDHISLFLYPVYRQRLKQAHPVTKQIKLWTPESEITLQDCFALTDWDVFKAAATVEDSSISVQDYAEYVSGYISTCVDNIVPTLQIRKFPNQKPWINSQVRHMLRARSLAFRSGNENEYKAAKYGLRKAITAAKRQYREKLDSFYSTADSGRMWQGLQHITDYRTTTNNIASTDSLPDDLNNFYARFEAPSDTAERELTHTWLIQPPSPPPTISTTQKEVSFWFATGGAGFCLSRSLALKMKPWASDGAFMDTSENIRLPDDCTVGYIVERLLGVSLIRSALFHSHLENLGLVSDIHSQVTLSYGTVAHSRNTVNIKGAFSPLQDPTRFRSVHCLLYPDTPWCPGPWGGLQLTGGGAEVEQL